MKHFTRRRVLKMAGLVALTSAAGTLLPLPRLRAAQPAAQTPALAEFMQVSQQLTQLDDLNSAVGTALFHALTITQKNFTTALTQLSALLTSQPDLLQQERLTFAETQAAEEKLAKVILGGWYNGVVGKGNAALYVTYVNTLASELVKDKLVPQSFSYGKCGSWAQQP
ncbi:sugar dehydrogenase complex small subunit [Erwinia pyri]|uniref:Sugar dehydrogenase complex small subunit n=1 Tax=Erwinia pyri TaxID=3062598 RepID=A0AA50HNU3_9GAMM|nr:sugar dehydrogenase complex small subunit [Erwinia sp. DE2]WLS80526.1 sugar dehydrogenase complex small subunit [Erwinia sp. DE2]